MSTSTISNSVTDATGAPAVGVPVVIKLFPRTAFRSNDSEIIKDVVLTTDSSGNWSTALERNSDVSPANSFYVVEEKVPGNFQSYAFQVGATTATLRDSIVDFPPAGEPIAYLTQAAGDARYERKVYKNIYDYGAVGDGVANDLPALLAAKAACVAAGGGMVFLPFGNFLMDDGDIGRWESNVDLEGIHQTQWPFRHPQDICTLSFGPNYDGDAAIELKGAELTGSLSNEGNCRFKGFNIDGKDHIADGISLEGEVLSVEMGFISIVDVTHNGTWLRKGAGALQPHDIFMDTVVSYSAGNFGHSWAVTDGYARDCIAASSGVDGFFFGLLAMFSITGCQSLFNSGHGARFTGGIFGPVTVTDFITDRNNKNGIRCDTSTGVTPIHFNGLVLRRDGKNNNGGGGSFASFSVDSFTNPIYIDGILATPGVDDGGAGTNSPQFSISVTNNAGGFVSVDHGLLHAATTTINWDGTGEFRRGLNVVEATGPAGAPAFVTDTGIQGTINGDLAANGHALGLPRPQSHGAVAWTMDPIAVTGGTVLTGGTIYVAGLYIPKKCTLTKFFWGITTAGATPTAGQNFISLYKADGTQVASVNVDARISTANGFFTETINASVTPGEYFAVFLFNASTIPAVLRGPAINAALVNFNLTAATARFATNVTGRTTLPNPLVPASNVNSSIELFAAVA